MVWPKPSEKAILTIDGAQYSDWETVMVRHALREPPIYYCRFTCSENAPLTKNFMAMHIMPGADCTVTLGGLLAFTGKVTTRQVFYDAKRHHIEIQAANFNEIMLGSVVHESMEWKDKTLEQIVRDVLKPVKLNLKVEGGALPTDKIPIWRATPSEKIFDFIDHLTRSFSSGNALGISFTSNVQGDFVLVVGPNGGVDAVTEGDNILEGRETIYDPNMGKDIATSVQAPSNNKIWGAAATHIPFLSQTLDGLGKIGGAPPVVISEIPATDKNILKGRTTTERNWMMEDLITVFATVQGWMRPSGGLWYRDQTVTVNSPMLVMNGNQLTAKTVTFTQDDRTGTRTTLELVNANVLSGLTPQEGT